MIDLKKEQFGAQDGETNPAKQGRELKTKVLVDNGSTIVIGGVYNFDKVGAHSGIPFLKDIPLIGWLFRSPYSPVTNKSELIIFITPRIINQEKAGLATNG